MNSGLKIWIAIGLKEVESNSWFGDFGVILFI